MPDETRQPIVYLQLRLSPEQHALCQQLAKADGRSVSNWVRWVLEQHTARAAEKASDGQ